MKRGSVFIILGVTCVLLVLTVDLMCGAAARRRWAGLWAEEVGGLHTLLEDVVGGHYRVTRALPQQEATLGFLSGVQLGLYLHPFTWQREAAGDATIFFQEAGVMAYRLTVR